MTARMFGLERAGPLLAAIGPRLAAIGLWPTALLVVVGVFVSAPVIFLVLGSFSVAELPTEFDLTKLSLVNYVVVWIEQETFTLLYNTVVYVTGATAVGVGFAALLAWLVERTNMPGKLLIMDYNWIVAKSSHDWRKQEGEIKGVPEFARHMGKINVLLTGQEVVTLRPEQIDPGNYVNLTTLWMP